MYTRRLTRPTRSFLLLGSRGTDKTTWLRKVLPKAHWVNLLLDQELVRLLREPLDGTERGFLLETAIYHELSAHLAYALCGGDLAYYRTPAGSEVDFIWQRGATRIGIEVKASPRWRPSPSCCS